MQGIGKRIQKCREEAGMTQEVIGIYAPVLENGERTADVAKELENKYN